MTCDHGEEALIVLVVDVLEQYAKWSCDYLDVALVCPSHAGGLTRDFLLVMYHLARPNLSKNCFGHMARKEKDHVAYVTVHIIVTGVVMVGEEGFPDRKRLSSPCRFLLYDDDM